MQPFTVIIPARHASTRLPGKMLADIAGVPMVIRVAQRALQSNAKTVVIAADHIDIVQAASCFGINSLETSVNHSTGTDRLAQAVELLNLADNEIVVNVQGDEPLIEPSLINKLAAFLALDEQADIATCASPIHSTETLFNPNAVKVVCDSQKRALYFSRAPIPWHRDALSGGQRVLAQGLPALHHIGVYAYRVGFLKKFPKLAPGILEKIESLEQLRAMEHGYRIAVQTVQTPPVAGVDTFEDLERVRAVFARSA